MQNSGHGGPHMTPFMTIFVFLCFCVNSPILNNLMNMRSINTGRYLIQSLIKFPFECHRNHVWRPIFSTPVMTIFINVNILDKSDSPIYIYIAIYAYMRMFHAYL